MHSIKTNQDEVQLSFGARHKRGDLPKNALPPQGMAAATAQQIITDQMQFDANPSLNLASFVNTWMEPEADALMGRTLCKNLIDQEEYPQTTEIASRVLSIVANLFHAPGDAQAVGCITGGSSEAIMLALLAHKRSWQQRRRASGKSTQTPNVVFGADAHTCLEKFARYFEVEPRIIALEPDSLTIHAAKVQPVVDENTIAVVGILGTTFTGQMDDIADLNELLVKLNQSHGWHIPLHIDAASGGFVVPFTHPRLKWDFRLSQVRSINVSNHKFGLVYPGLGTLVFRQQSDVPDELVFHINYLGGDMPNYSLNFSRPSGQVVAQYYNFLRLGHAGYTEIMKGIMDNARHLAQQVGNIKELQLLGDATLFPVVAAKATDPEALSLNALTQKLRESGWVIPAYSLPKNAEATTVMRMVVRENLSRDMVDVLVRDLQAGVQHVRHAPPSKRPRAHRPIC